MTYVFLTTLQIAVFLSIKNYLCVVIVKRLIKINFFILEVKLLHNLSGEENSLSVRPFSSQAAI